MSNQKLKAKFDPRHQKRIKIIQNLFTYSFQVNKKISLPYPNNRETKLIIKKISKFDNLINQYADKHPIEKISKADLAILRWAIFELTQKKLPIKVIIDEAIELAKEFGGERSFAFVNAILGKILFYFQKNEKES